MAKIVVDLTRDGGGHAALRQPKYPADVTSVMPGNNSYSMTEYDFVLL